MQRFVALCILVALEALFVRPADAQQSATVTGTVTDAAEGFPLYGANVVVLGSGGSDMVAGAATDEVGEYVIEDVPPGSYVIEFRFVGYGEERVPITLAAGETASVDAALDPTGFDLNTVIVTASRQPEKVLDAPASISVLGTEDIETNVLPSSAAVLRNTMGVDMAQTGIDRYEIVVRGFNNAFSGAAYVLTDYRQGAVPSLGVNAYQMMPITQIDLERVEVVRGPGSALYGAGVDAGVIHFITKDPFTYPGTTVSVGGGSREMVVGSARHAGVVNDKLGYKIVGNFSRGEEWHFNPNNALDAIQLCSFRSDIEGDDLVDVPCEIDGETEIVERALDYGYHKYNLNGTVSYRFRPDVTLTANGGFSSSKSIFLSGIGTLQSDGFGYSYGQLRLDAGSFFAQAYVNANNAGDSFVYRETAVEEVVDNSILFNTQAQYDFGLMDDRIGLIVGADYELTRPATKETITGRNEDEDQTHEVGAYLQGTTSLTPQLDFTGAVRTDYNTVVEQVQLSPRAALVYKPTAEHSIRATYNRAFSSPGTNSLFLDIDAGSVGALTIQARGAADGFNYQRTAGGNLIASSLIPEVFGSEMPVGMPLGVVYRIAYDTLSAIPAPVIQQMLQQGGVNMSEAEVEQLVALLSPFAGTNVTGVTERADDKLGYVNLTTQMIDRFANDVTDIQPLEQSVSQTFEVGYKGLFGQRLLLAVDGYYVQKRNFVGPLVVESPFVLAPPTGDVVEDFGPAVEAGFANNAELSAFLEGLGYSTQQIAAILGAFASPLLAEELPAEGSPIGIVQPAENDTPGQLLLSYRDYGRVSYYGVDLSMQLLVNDNLDLFGNLSWVSDNFFDADELDEEGTTLQLAMNAPEIKLKGGFKYSVPRGLRASASVRYTGGFDVISGPYEGRVEPYTLVDLGLGYDLSSYVNGLTFDVTVLNAFDEVHREFIGAPQLGRLAIARLTYNMD